ncbi:Mitochondrial import inner membrane translocase subunit tim22 [Coccidioides posadasii str. Silveira]|uniref:Mitochondrial import inner membrane translocase subunit TIM22 n=3 Tax=Coccidioides posadasii TaxID=199306 RepID=E9CST5_COCPS|nr:Mitochondrial import inner membrane translocase subunit Tim17 family protein [Coccidioides posadasii C735 delta SOWgp]EER27589.1 Mitochondrial import inner membrane translocase subunit Tim17 family protein [Coccidioides posadasii C735 delta SOWgp]EFW22745.1 mitochondrial import inner membrane translocase subunit tim22 [Coccidioides posadasii str. Silveira]KMM67458.1 mitochondrial import inner membrane translocase subunit TIM22 [Coccidioides posadasii RMSCC 3488]QVM11683.1 Mitochondrial impor|eukprot:XP_003069734.1 Mitochondrial import inner membrane translocase subunit Tim17 family protein [Coccidioides posadasii C735 delta SOWgp]
MSFPGMTRPGAAAGAAPGGMSEQEQAIVRNIQAAMESCPMKAVMAGGMGFALGGAFGLFMSSMSYDTPLTPQGREISSLPVREQLRRGFKDMGSRSFSSAKNFAIVGALFSGTECCIEGLRAKNDLTNGIAAGCITGGILGAKAGPQAAALGCAGFAAFSAAIDAYMRQPSD